MSELSDVKNGAALAAFFAASIGAFAMGLIVILNEAGIYAAPSLYGPAGGLSGRTTFAVIAWLVAWGVLHSRWSKRQIESTRVYPAALALILLSLVMTFPPVWKLMAG